MGVLHLLVRRSPFGPWSIISGRVFSLLHFFPSSLPVCFHLSSSPPLSFYFFVQHWDPLEGGKERNIFFFFLVKKMKNDSIMHLMGKVEGTFTAGSVKHLGGGGRGQRGQTCLTKLDRARVCELKFIFDALSTFETVWERSLVFHLVV